MQTDFPATELIYSLQFLNVKHLGQLLAVRSTKSVETEKPDIWHFNILEQVI